MLFKIIKLLKRSRLILCSPSEYEILVFDNESIQDFEHILKNSKLTLKAANIPKSQNAKILKFISKTHNKVNSNSVITSLVSKNPIQLNKEDLTIIIKKILEK